jgi:hypothetical protein
MTEDQLNSLKRWFSRYTGSFFTSSAEDNKNYRLKIEHSHNVCLNIIEIAKGQSLDDNSIILAETIALLHDIGRFPQFKTYRTFMDRKSANHGAMGADMLIKEGVLQDLPEEDREIIINSVRYHGVFNMPDLNDPDKLFFLKMIRDADKLDILRVFIDHYKSNDDDRASAAAHGLSDNSEYSEKVISHIYTKTPISYADLTTLNDFKLMHLSWGYALNFKSAYILLKERGYLDRLISNLPQTDEIVKVGGLVQEYLLQRLNESAEQ